MLPLPISIYPPPLLLTYSLLFLHHPTHIYTHQRRFFTPLVPNFYFIPALPPISLFWYFIWLFPCYQHHPPPLNTHYHCFHNPSHPCLAHPIPLPCLVPLLHFAFLVLSMAIALLPAPSPTIKYSLSLFSQSLPPLPGPSHPPALPGPPTSFRFFGTFYGYCPATSTIPH